MFAPGGHVRAIRSTMRAWAQSDRAGAMAFVRAELSDGNSRNAAVAGIVLAVAKVDPAGARKWIETITDNDPLKAELLESLKDEIHAPTLE